MDDADHQDQGSRGKAEPLCLETAGQEQVRHHGQPGGKQLREAGIRVKSLAIVDRIENGQIVLRPDDD